MRRVEISMRWIALFSLTVGVLLFALLTSSYAQPVSESEARSAVVHWLQMKGEHFGESMGDSIVEIHRFQGNDSGRVGYYLVLLNKGWLVLPADDQFWPVQIFGSSKMTLDFFLKHPVYRMLRFDQPQDQTARRGTSLSEGGTDDSAHNTAAWNYLRSSSSVQRRGIDAASDPSRPPLLPNYSDVRIAPLLGQERYWGQRYPFNHYANYNYLIKNDTRYSPYPEGNEWFAVGCVGLSNAQLAYYHMSNRQKLYRSAGQLQLQPLSGNYPVVITRVDAQNNISSKDVSVKPIGGYLWNDMSYSGSDPRSVDQQKINNIAALLHDAGIFALAHYYKPVRDISRDEHSTEGETLANFAESQEALQKMGFSHSSNLYTVDIPAMGLNPKRPQRFLQEDLNNIINTNLDLRLPVVVGVIMVAPTDPRFQRPLGHQVVVDGYAFPSYAAATQDVPRPYYHAVTGYSQEIPGGGWFNDAGIWCYALTETFGGGGVTNTHTVNHANSIRFNVFASFDLFARNQSSKEPLNKSRFSFQQRGVSAKGSFIALPKWEFPVLLPKSR